jgi:hypothetical protein
MLLAFINLGLFMQENLFSLDEIKSHFEHWRTTRAKQRERIPQCYKPAHLNNDIRHLIFDLGDPILANYRAPSQIFTPPTKSTILIY